MLGIGLRVLAILWFLISFAFGFVAIFAPWQYLGHDDNANGFKLKRYLYRQVLEERKNGTTRKYKHRLWTYANRICNNWDRYECIMALYNYHASSACIGLIVVSMFFALVFMIATWIYSTKHWFLKMAIMISCIAACLPIFIHPLSVPLFVDFTDVRAVLYVGFWMWICAALFSIMVLLGYYADNTYQSKNRSSYRDDTSD